MSISTISNSFLGHKGYNKASAPGGGDEAHQHRATAPSHLTRDSVRLADLVLPVASPHRDNGELGQDDGPADGSGYFFEQLTPRPTCPL